MGDWFVGEIRLFPYNRTPDGWLDCNGQSLPVSQYQALYALLGNQYGGNTIAFNLPDLRGRVPVCYGSSPDPNTIPNLQNCGVTGGTESVTLTLPQLPPHIHQFGANPTNVSTVAALANSVPSTSTRPSAAPPSVPAAPNLYAPPGAPQALNPASIAPAGSGGPHENRQPFQALRYCIAATSGLFPPRQ